MGAMASFGRYKVLFPLGAGGMAEVFLAQDAGAAEVAGAERLVVIKRVLPALALDEQFIAMFLNEARISTRLNHPNIAHVYEVGQQDGTYYLAMEFIHGADLGAILRRSAEARLTPPLAALIASRAAGALHHAHQLSDLQGAPLGVVHRDVSPQNIRVSFEGVVKVLDFGIAKATTNADSTQSGILKGKYPYMSPEQLDGLPLDGRSDVFALGIVLHEMICCRRLFKRESTVQTLKEVAQGVIPRPSEVAGVPIAPELDAIVMRALERDRDRRFQSARELQRQLDVFLRSYPATDTDLEEFMAVVYGGDAKAQRARLREAVQEGALAELLSHTPSRAAAATSSAPGTGAERAPTRGHSVTEPPEDHELEAAAEGEAPAAGGLRGWVILALGALLMAGLGALTVTLLRGAMQ